MRSLTPVLVWWTALLSISLACTKEEAKTVADVSTKIADDVCKEEANQPNQPEWVAIACKAEGVAAPIVHVLLPRAEWDAARGRKPAPCASGLKPAFDAGPGK